MGSAKHSLSGRKINTIFDGSAGEDEAVNRKRIAPNCGNEPKMVHSRSFFVYDVYVKDRGKREAFEKSVNYNDMGSGSFRSS